MLYYCDTVRSEGEEEQEMYCILNSALYGRERHRDRRIKVQKLWEEKE